MQQQGMKKFLSVVMALVLLLGLYVPSYAAAEYTLSGDGIFVEVDANMSMTVYRVEADGSKTAMTQKPTEVTPDIFSDNTVWSGKLPWSVATGTGANDFVAASAKLLSDKSGYITFGTRPMGGNNTGTETVVDDFVAASSTLEENVTTYFGAGDRLTVTGTSASANITRILVIETSYANPGVVSVTSKYRNNGAENVDVARFVENNYKIYDELPDGQFVEKKREAGLWTQQGAALHWGYDDVVPVFDTMGTRSASAYTSNKGSNNDMSSRNNWFWASIGGTPFNDFYGTNVGISIGSAMPYQVRGMELPTRGSGILGKHDTAYTWIGWPGQTLVPGEIVDAGTSIVTVHTGDYFAANQQYAQAMGHISHIEINGQELPSDWLALPKVETLPDRAYMPIWESWGMGESWDPLYMYHMIPEFKELGIKSVELDAGWYPRNDANLGEGLYLPATSKWEKFAAEIGMPCTTTEEAMLVVKKFTDIFHEEGFFVDAWCMPSVFQSANTTWATNPFITKNPDYAISTTYAKFDPATGALLEGTPTMAREGGYYPQSRTYDICLGNPKVLEDFTDYFVELIFETYGFDGLKIDSVWSSQQCFAEGHGHDGNPNASIENWSLFYKIIYDKAKEIKGNEVMVKNCACGTVMNFYNFNGTNRPIPGDNGGARQVRYMAKKYKGLYGDVPVDGDHLELGQAVHNNLVDGIDFKSYVGTGAVLDTKYITRKFDAGVPVAQGVAPMSYPGDANYGSTRANWGDYKRFFDISNTEELTRGHYIGDLYKYGFDYPEAYVIDKADAGVRYYSFYTTNYTVGTIANAPQGTYKRALVNNGDGNAVKDRNATADELIYNGDIELRGLTPGGIYSVIEYAVTDYTVEDLLNPKADINMGLYVADANGLIVLSDVEFNRSLLLKAVAQDLDLAGLIALAEDLDENDYTTSSWASFQTVLADAKVVAEKTDATGSEIEAAILALTDAIRALVRNTGIIVLSTDAHNVIQGDDVTIKADFVETTSTNTIVLNYTFDPDKFEFVNYTLAADSGITLVNKEFGDGYAKITLMAPNYTTDDLGALLLRAKADSVLYKERQVVKVIADYVAKDAGNIKTVEKASASVSFRTLGDGTGTPIVKGDTNGDGILDLIDLSNMIDWFGFDTTHPDWEEIYVYFDLNNSGRIDIDDITYVARRI